MKVLTILFLTLICLIFLRCSEDSPESPPANSTGKLFVQSNPSGAHIYLKGINTGKTTPDTIKNLAQGTYDGFLYLQYYDTAYFTATVFNNTTTTIDSSLKDGLPMVEFLFDFQIAFNDDSVRFNFTINQDVTMDSIKVGRPVNSTGTSVTDKYSYNAKLFEARDQSGNLIKYYLPPSESGLQYYPAIQNNDYYFSMFGHKAYGAKLEFRSYYLVRL
ncbi:MAG: PEGA domain-containing protein [Ignavibacteria bacterium]|nr:PEGA domain-containing protein [Ignavibacteria bacterium]